MIRQICFHLEFYPRPSLYLFSYVFWCSHFNFVLLFRDYSLILVLDYSLTITVMAMIITRLLLFRQRKALWNVATHRHLWNFIRNLPAKITCPAICCFVFKTISICRPCLAINEAVL